MADRHHFLVLSSGFCGSLWLGAQLDRHPDISCTCNGFIGLAYPHESGVDFSKHDPAYWTEIHGRLDIGTPEKLLAKVDARKPARLVGDVHGFRVESYLESRKAEAHRPAVLAHLIRHPVTLLERIAQEHAFRYMAFPRIAAEMPNGIKQVAPRLASLFAGLPLDFSDLRTLSLILAVWDLVRVVQEIRLTPELRLLPFERLVAEPDVFADMLSFLSGGAVTGGAAYLDTVFSAEGREAGRYRKSKVSHRVQPDEQFARWTAAEQEVFRRLARTMGMAEAYAPAGYAFGFLS